MRNLLAPVGIRLLPDLVVVLQPLALWAACAPGLPRRLVAPVPLPGCRLAACQGQLAQAGLTTASACRQGSCSRAVEHLQWAAGSKVAEPLVNVTAGRLRIPELATLNPLIGSNTPLQQALSVNCTCGRTQLNMFYWRADCTQCSVA